MNLFKKQPTLSESELEARVKENFCNLKVVACDFSYKSWCPRKCNYIKQAEYQIKYWGIGR